jgi:hypothetical protein
MIDEATFRRAPKTVRRLTVEIAERKFDALLAQARAEKRPVRNQASWLLERAIAERPEMDPPDQSKTQAAVAA